MSTKTELLYTLTIFNLNILTKFWVSDRLMYTITQLMYAITT